MNGQGAVRPGSPYQDHDMAKATSQALGKTLEMKNPEDGDSPDLDTARGLVPAILVGAVIWAIAFAIAVLIWG